MDEPGRKIVREELFKVIENQMKDGNPRETKETFQRLRDAGYSRQETMKMLASVLIVEMNNMFKENRVFNEAGYVKMLKALPHPPWEEEMEAHGDLSR